MADLLISDGMFNMEDHMHLPWDSLREQDWTSLGSSECDASPWEMINAVGVGNGHDALPGYYDVHEKSPGQFRMLPRENRGCLELSPVSLETGEHCFFDGLHASATLNDGTRKDANHTSSGAQQNDFPHSNPVCAADAKVNREAKKKVPNGRMVHTGCEVTDDAAATCAESSMFRVQLYVTAIADGKVMSDAPYKLMSVLDQVRGKVSKEQNTVVQVKNEGSVDLKMRVFVANSIEAGALSEYIASHPHQMPAPFVVLAKKLHMAVTYDPRVINLSQASVADRLRKQIKTHAVKVLREAIGNKSCSINTSALRGHQGPLAPADAIEPLVQLRAIKIDSDHQNKYIVIPAKTKTPRDESSPSPSPRQGPLSRVAPSVLVIPSNPHSPDTSAPSTPCSFRDDDESLSAHFPVNLFVTAIAEGALANDTPQKVKDRLSQIVCKVPKEQNTSVEVCDASTIDLKMRVFVVNSEDAKAVGDYIFSHLEQLPAPFVVLARHLPMAVLYDPVTLDLTDASVADRLRKQAKTRAVKVLRECIAQRSLGITMNMLRGHEGPLKPAEHLHDTLQSLTQPVGSEEEPFIVFAARNKASSVQSSPRKRGNDAVSVDDRSADGHPNKVRVLSANQRRSGASSASHLHRDMLDKALRKSKTCEPPETPPP